MNDALDGVLVQIAAQSPSLIVDLTGLVLALVFWGRCPRPAACVFAASVILLLGSVGGIVTQYALLQAQAARHWSMAQTGGVLSAIGIAGSLFHAVAIGLLLAAAFQGRSAQRAEGKVGQPGGV